MKIGGAENRETVERENLFVVGCCSCSLPDQTTLSRFHTGGGERGGGEGRRRIFLTSPVVVCVSHDENSFYPHEGGFFPFSYLDCTTFDFYFKKTLERKSKIDKER